jgi:hypothetical protein
VDQGATSMGGAARPTQFIGERGTGSARALLVRGKGEQVRRAPEGRARPEDSAGDQKLAGSIRSERARLMKSSSAWLGPRRFESDSVSSSASASKTQAKPSSTARDR